LEKAKEDGHSLVENHAARGGEEALQQQEQALLCK